MRHPEEIGIVYGAVNGIQGILEGTIIRVDDQFETAADFDLLCHTPSSALGSCRYKMPSPDKGPEQYAKILAMFRKYNIGYFAYIGGNDSMDTANKIADYCYEHGEEVRVVGVPKTIDNDLPITDHCPGFGSGSQVHCHHSDGGGSGCRSLPHEVGGDRRDHGPQCRLAHRRCFADPGTGRQLCAPSSSTCPRQSLTRNSL